MLRHLLHQEEARLKAGEATHFERGDRADVQRLLDAVRTLTREFRIYIVQPRLSKAKIAPAFLDVLGATETFLQETYSMPLRVVTSP